jgi:hypothetical protein
MERLFELLTDRRPEPLIVPYTFFAIHQKLRAHALRKLLAQSRHRRGTTVHLRNKYYSISELIEYSKIIKEYFKVDTFIIDLYINDDTSVVDLRQISVPRLEVNAFFTNYDMDGRVLIDSSRIESLKFMGTATPQLDCPAGREPILRELIMGDLPVGDFDEETCRSIRWIQSALGKEAYMPMDLVDTSIFTDLRHHRIVFHGPFSLWEYEVETLNSQTQVIILEKIYRRHVVLKGETEEVIIENGRESVVEILGSPKEVILLSCINVRVVTTAKVYDFRDSVWSMRQNAPHVLSSGSRDR